MWNMGCGQVSRATTVLSYEGNLIRDYLMTFPTVYACEACIVPTNVIIIMYSVTWPIIFVNAPSKNGIFHGPHISFSKLFVSYFNIILDLMFLYQNFFFFHILILHLGLNNAARIHTFPQEKRKQI